MRILEISFGAFDEEDIVCVEDVYGRVGSGEEGRPPAEVSVADARLRGVIGN